MKTNDYLINKIIKWIIFNPFWTTSTIIVVVTTFILKHFIVFSPNISVGEAIFVLFALNILSLIVCYGIGAFIQDDIEFLCRLYDYKYNDEACQQLTYYQTKYLASETGTCDMIHELTLQYDDLMNDVNKKTKKATDILNTINKLKQESKHIYETN